VPIDYDTDRPVIRVRAQDLYGTTTHPSVSDQAVVVHVLSPAGRPIQVTADVPGFWAGTWAQVRREMAGRYPKHHWPADPTTASRR
jgi:ATP-dependent helicase HrpB